MDAKKVGLFIAEKRKEREMTQKELAEKLQVSDKAVSRWERGLGFPDINLFETLSEVLEVSVIELMKGGLLENDKLDISEAENIMQSTFDIAAFQNKIAKRQVIIFSLIGIIGIFSLILGLMFHSYGHFSFLSRPVLLGITGIAFIIIFLIYCIRKLSK